MSITYFIDSIVELNTCENSNIDVKFRAVNRSYATLQTHTFKRKWNFFKQNE